MANSKKTFKNLMESAISILSERSQEIVRARFGVGGKSCTLNEIGNKYGITRERVRQIIKESINKVQKKEAKGILIEARKDIKCTIKNNSDIIHREEILDIFGDDTDERGAVEFFLECLDDVNVIEKKGEIKKAYADHKFDLEHWKKVKEAAKTTLKNRKETLEGKAFYNAFKDEFGSNFDVTEGEFLNFLKVSEEIQRNSFEKWGLTHWSEISPKGARQKAFLVLKETKKPLHFREVAELIDEYKLSKKKTHPQTVHNELIKDEKFVLVGRGVYALSEWGYKEGTVKDVIEDILKKNNKPMNKDEILTQALAVRKVKKSTVVINLNSFFEKIDEDKYFIGK